MAAIDIDVLYVPDCPNLARARARVREALARSGVTASVREVRVDGADAAARAGMRGSPTILVDGRDPFPTADGTSLSCRLYATAAGFDGAPSVDQLVAVLSTEAPAPAGDERDQEHPPDAVHLGL